MPCPASPSGMESWRSGCPFISCSGTQLYEMLPMTNSYSSGTRRYQNLARRKHREKAGFLLHHHGLSMQQAIQRMITR